MKSTLFRLTIGWLIFMMSLPALWAQDNFNPSNPPDPEANLYYQVTVASDPVEAANVSGAGKYYEGTSVWIRYSLKTSGFKFKHWTLNGEVYTTSTSFYYKMGTEHAHFVAHFEYDPTPPSDPSYIDVYRIYLQSDPEGACSFNINNGTKVVFDNYQTVTAYPNQSFVFQGWYDNGKLVSTNRSFNYLMPARDVTLTARFIYNPANPSDPEWDGTQSDVQTTMKGDVNKDGVVNVKDVVAVINRSLDHESTLLGVYDINGDGKVDVKDVVQVINLSLNQQTQ